MKLKNCLAAALAAVIALTPVYAPVRAQTSATATLLPPGKQCFQATAGVNGMIGTIGAITAGSLYTNGTYGGVPLTGGSGANATANITIAGGSVTAVTILNPGTQYVIGDVLSAAAATIGGSGSGFSFPVASTSINSSLAGGSVAYYVPNTLTTKQTWQNANETTLNQNPVPLDINGCAIVYGSGIYRQILKDSLSNTVWDVVTASTGGSSGGGGTPSIGDGLPVGFVIPWIGTSLPTNYMWTAGQTVSRTTYSILMNAITYQSVILCQLGVATVTVPTSVSDGAPIGAPVEASCFAPGTTIASKTSGLLTMSTNATTTVSTSMVVFPEGDGDGATTFNLPDYRGRTLVGRNNMTGTPSTTLTAQFYGNGPNALGITGGTQSTQLSTASLPPYTPTGIININDPGHTHGYPTLGNTPPLNLTGGSGVDINPSTGTTGNSVTGLNSTNVLFSGSPQGGTQQPISIIQPSITSDYIVKVLPDTSVSTSNIAQLLPGAPNELAGTDSSGIWGNITVPTGLTVSSSALNFNIPALPVDNSPNANNNYVIEYNAAGNATNRVSLGQIATSATAGVSTYNGLTGSVGGQNSHTTSYTILNTDCEKTVQMGTGATGYIQITLPAVSGFPASCKVTVQNGDSGRGKKLVGFPSGLTTQGVLWPLQEVVVQIVNGAWVVISDPGRWRLPSTNLFPNTPTTYTWFVSNTVGNDGNDGLAAGNGGAFNTMQEAVNTVCTSVDMQGQFVVIQVADGAYTGTNGTHLCNVTGMQVIGGHVELILRGNVASLGNVSATATGTGQHTFVMVGLNTPWRIEGFGITSTSGACVSADGNSFLYLGTNNYGSCPVGHVNSSFRSFVEMFPPYTISGNAAFHINAGDQSQVLLGGGTVTIVNTPAFSTAFSIVNNLSEVNIQSSINTFSGAATGQRYACGANSMIQTFGAATTYFPGSTAGSATSGCLYQ